MFTKKKTIQKYINFYWTNSFFLFNSINLNFAEIIGLELIDRDIFGWWIMLLHLKLVFIYALPGLL